MTRASDPPVDGDPHDASLDAELGRILEAYLADLEAGRPVDPDRLLAEHPSLASQLRSCLAVVNLADRVADGSGSRDVPGRAASGFDTTASGPAGSARTTPGLGSDAGPRIYLREMPDEPEPMIRPRSDAMPVSPEGGLGRYQLHGEIARGGMGAVLRGRDADLGRDLAIKVLLEAHRDHPDMVRRFIEEAQIGGQLQHPGIVPIYELGAFPDRRPYFAMKLVKGRTLAALLQKRPDPRHELPRFLSIFEQVCQTMAYAHARGVIHRDLKPSNIMVGSFGEVQVMDWGLAKVLPQGGIADEGGSRPAQETVITTVRSGPAGSDGDSQRGSVLGTPSYMAPEQARGEVERVDERADVFGLGAILCEILTGRPPFGGSSRNEIRARAARGDLAGALSRLDVCGADAELLALAHGCLAAEPEERPRNAGEVARRMSAYQAGVQDRLRAAELARVEAQTRAEEERKRRHVTVALAASILGLVLLGGGGWAFLARQRMERVRRMDLAASGVELQYVEAERAGGDLTRWAAAREAARALEASLADAPDAGTRDRLAARVRQVIRAATAADGDHKLLATLVDIRANRGDDLDGTMTDARFADAFREAGIDTVALSPAEATARIGARPATVRIAVAVALDEWAVVRRQLQGDQAGAHRLTEMARLADPDPWRNRLREVLQLTSGEERLATLKELARSAQVYELPAVSLHLLGAAMDELGDPPGAEGMLRKAVRQYPGDVWLNLTLARCLEGLSRREEAIRYYMAARSIRPAAAHALAHALQKMGETDQAIAVFEDLARSGPQRASDVVCLSEALNERGRAREAQDLLDASISDLRAEIGRQPGRFRAHFVLGAALRRRGNLNEAVAEYRAALRLKPDSADAHGNLGIVLRDQGKLDEAIAECRAALRLKPDFAEAHSSLGNALSDQGKLDEAIAECRAALRLKPDFAWAHCSLGNALSDQGKLDEAIAECRAALRLKPDFAEAHNNLGNALRVQGKLDEAVAECRAALRLKPDLAEAHNNLGNALRVQGKLDEAVAEYRAALRLKPDLAEAHGNLGNALRVQGKLDEAVAECRAALRLKPDFAEAHCDLGDVLRDQGKLDEAVAECRAALRLKPDFAEAHCNLGNVLRVRGKLDEAIAEYRAALRLKPDSAHAHGNLGIVLRDQGKLDEAITEYRAALRLKPDYAEAHCNLGQLLLQHGRFTESLAELKRGHELGSKRPTWQYPSAQWVRDAQRLVELEQSLPAIVADKVKTADAAESLTVAQMYYWRKLHGASARFWAEAFQSQPKLAEDMQAANRYNAACAAALAGCGQGKDDPPLDETARIRWRKQAIDWLKADLAAWSKILESGPPQARPFITQTFQHWRGDSDLAGLREPAALAKLPDDEQKACRALWSEVETLLKQARAANPP